MVEQSHIQLTNSMQQKNQPLSPHNPEQTLFLWTSSTSTNTYQDQAKSRQVFRKFVFCQLFSKIKLPIHPTYNPPLFCFLPNPRHINYQNFIACLTTPDTGPSVHFRRPHCFRSSCVFRNWFVLVNESVFAASGRGFGMFWKQLSCRGFAPHAPTGLRSSFKRLQGSGNRHDPQTPAIISKDQKKKQGHDYCENGLKPRSNCLPMTLSCPLTHNAMPPQDQSVRPARQDRGWHRG